ncbi:hypothetical protein [Streptomyces sp. IMTB 2501]|nr:hypothetical protein [Streptomyces sp. IMTB 2501]
MRMATASAHDLQPEPAVGDAPYSASVRDRTHANRQLMSYKRA